MNGCNGGQLRGSQAAPAQRIDYVVLKGRVQLFEFAHRSMSSTEWALAAARSMEDISDSAKVSA